MNVYVSNRKKTKKKIREQRSANVANDQGTIGERWETLRTIGNVPRVNIYIASIVFIKSTIEANASEQN